MNTKNLGKLLTPWSLMDSKWDISTTLYKWCIC